MRSCDALSELRIQQLSVDGFLLSSCILECTRGWVCWFELPRCRPSAAEGMRRRLDVAVQLCLRHKCSDSKEDDQQDDQDEDQDADTAA